MVAICLHLSVIQGEDSLIGQTYSLSSMFLMNSFHGINADNYHMICLCK